MKVAVITPYFEEPTELIRRAHDSVRAQTHPCTHFLVADGVPNPEVDSWNARHMVVAGPHKDFGNNARGLGALSALSLGFEAFAFLDADNWYAPDHIESLLQTCIENRAPIAFSDIQIVLNTGQIVDVADPWTTDHRHVDTNGYFITSHAAFFLGVWTMIPPAVAAAGDQIVFDLMRQLGWRYAFTGRKTAFYETKWLRHYAKAGVTPPADARDFDWKSLGPLYSPAWLTSRLNLRGPQLDRVLRRNVGDVSKRGPTELKPKGRKGHGTPGSKRGEPS